MLRMIVGLVDKKRYWMMIKPLCIIPLDITLFSGLIYTYDKNGV